MCDFVMKMRSTFFKLVVIFFLICISFLNEKSVKHFSSLINLKLQIISLSLNPRRNIYPNLFTISFLQLVYAEFSGKLLKFCRRSRPLAVPDSKPCGCEQCCSLCQAKFVANLNTRYCNLHLGASSIDARVIINQNLC